MVPARFEEQLVGANTGDEITINVKFPEDYHAEELKGKDSEFKVKIHEIQKQEIPEINDEFASDVSEFDTLAEYRADLAKKLAENKEKTSKAAMTEEALKAAIDNAELDIPECMIDAEVATEMKRTENQVGMYGMTLENYCQYMGTTVEKFRENIRPQAEMNVRRDLVLEAISEAEAISVSDEEFEKEFEQAAEYLKKTVEEVKEMFKDRRDDIAEEVKRRKAVDLIYETAVKVPAAEKQEPEEKAAEEAKPAAAKRKASSKKAEEKKEEDA